MMAIIPIMFKMGVMMMMLVVLMFLTLKSVTIGGLLLFIAATSLLSKFKHWMSPHHHHAYHHAADVGEKNIHLHIHTDGHGTQWGSTSHIEPHSSGYSSYPSSSYGSPSSYGSSYSEGNSWSRQGVVGGLSSGGDALSITGTLNGQRIHIPLPSGRSPAGFSSPATSYSASSSEDYTFLGKAASR
uniref:Uncharacterized protein n=1 Tax=Cacopsylla melanoneura TaxID=428564 RepID=A0A8D8PUZ6_9HEMI